MPMIEGVGDEVVIFLAIVLLVVLIIFAWLSTNLRYIPFVNVIVLHSVRQREQQPNNQLNNNDSNSISNNNYGTQSTESVEQVEPQQAAAESNLSNDAVASEEQPEEESGIAGEEQESDDNSSFQDSNLSTQELRQRRLEYFNLQESKPGDDSGGESTSQSMAGESVKKTNSSANPVNSESANNIREQTENVSAEEQIAGQLRIRLKYLDDTLRIVYAWPADTIGDFRRSHFASELAENQHVRFIFQGHCLGNDRSTLQSCGIDDNSVIHCLITHTSQFRAPHQQGQHNSREFNIGTLFFPIISVILGVVWYFQVNYHQYFTFTTTVTLVFFTVVSIIAFCLTWRNPRVGVTLI